MASPTHWTWLWVDSRSWWWTGRPGMLQFMGSDTTEPLNWTEIIPELYLSSCHCPATKMNITLKNSMRNEIQGMGLKHVMKAGMAKGIGCVREARRTREIENHHSNVRELAWKPQAPARGWATGGMATAAGRNAAGLGHSPPDTAEDTSGWESPVAICQCCHHCPQGAIMFLSALLGVPRRQGFEHQPTQICWCPCNMLCLDGPDIANKNTGCPVKFYFFKRKAYF